MDCMHKKHFSFLDLSIVMAGWNSRYAFVQKERKKDGVHIAKVIR